MTEIVPFRALRYHPRFAAEMARLVAPPYDVISAQELTHYLKLHPRNVVRLILPGEAGRREDGSFYSGAAALLHRWQEEGTLQQDPEASFYPYRQTYRGPDGKEIRRLGFLGALTLPPRGGTGRTVLPHEKTLDAPRQDRTRLIEACRANLSPIFLLHPDTTGGAGRCLESAAHREPLFVFRDGMGVTHELWRMHEMGDVARLQEALLPDWTLIADGHHRFESAMDVRDRLPGDPGARYVLAFFCSLGDRGFRVFPIHRLLQERQAPGQEGDLAGILRQRHAVTDLPKDAEPEEILGRLREVGERHFAVIVRNAPPLLLRIDGPTAQTSDPLEELDTILLQREILTATLGISLEAVAGGAIGYTPDAGEAIRKVKRGEVEGAFLLNPLRVESVVRAAQAGLRLPQKSTYFYPKVYSGLVIRPF
ncbi:MAG: hypothetical protein DMH00_02375 [Acidobacteria bacterium]|nr:MAG: hypothetical protein DMH00_02375 [Acidobacteriota bacterium]